MATPRSMPSRSRSGFVTKMSSPTSWSRSPSRSVVGAPAVPVVLGVAVLERDDREAVGEAALEAGHLGRRELAPLEAVAAVGEELARGRDRARSRRGRDGPRARPPRGSPRSPPRSTRGPARSRPRRRRRSRGRARRAASSARGTISAADPQRLGERCPRPAGTTMNSCRSIELSACTPPLITFSIGTGSVVALVAAEVAEERHACVGGGGLRGRERDAEDRVRAEPALVRRPVELDQRAVERLLVGRVAARGPRRRSRR